MSNICIVIICCPYVALQILKLTLAFLSSGFLENEDKKYLKNEKSFQHGIKNIFHRYQMDFIEANKNNFLEGEIQI